MSFNSHSFSRYGKNFSEEIKSGMLRVIGEANPDILAIQEFYTRPEGPFDIRASLIRILGARYHFIEVIEKNDFETRGLAIFSKYPIENRKAVHFRSNKSRSEEHTSELQPLMRISSAVFCLTKKTTTQ